MNNAPTPGTIVEVVLEGKYPKMLARQDINRVMNDLVHTIQTYREFCTYKEFQGINLQNICVQLADGYIENGKKVPRWKVTVIGE